MAIIKTINGCVLHTGFTLNSYKLEDGECVVFRSRLAVQDGSGLNINEELFSDGNSEDTSSDHVTLSFNLANKKIVPGVYDWELLLKLPSGALMPLLPKKYNLLYIEESEAII